jgi:hypothetical protein
VVIVGRRAVTFLSVRLQRKIVSRGTRISIDIFLLMTTSMYFFMYLLISSLHMFRASQCSSSGDRIVLIHYLV